MSFRPEQQSGRHVGPAVITRVLHVSQVAASFLGVIGKREVYIKTPLLPDDPTRRQAMRKAFGFEQQINLRVSSHPVAPTCMGNTIFVPLGAVEPYPAMINELMGGTNLLARIEEMRRARTDAFSPQQALLLLRPVFEFLAMLNEMDLVDVDFGPANMMIDGNHVSWIDAGGVVSALEQNGDRAVVMHSPDCPPEVLDARRMVTPRTQVYLAANALKTLLTLEAPEAFERVLTYAPPRWFDRSTDPGRYRAFFQVLNTASHRNPDLRYANIMEFLREFEAIGRVIPTEPLFRVSSRTSTKIQFNIAPKPDATLDQAQAQEPEERAEPSESMTKSPVEPLPLRSLHPGVTAFGLSALAAAVVLSLLPSAAPDVQRQGPTPAIRTTPTVLSLAETRLAEARQAQAMAEALYRPIPDTAPSPVQQPGSLPSAHRPQTDRVHRARSSPFGHRDAPSE